MDIVFAAIALGLCGWLLGQRSKAQAICREMERRLRTHGVDARVNVRSDWRPWTNQVPLEVEWFGEPSESERARVEWILKSGGWKEKPSE